ncbi:hypothetical protein C8Q80DRAFT_1185924 [Daedaleopsis nitida]|nr:hypothetical protein C8Q80DRAFT_1185924 [Daedaleopsis nitida]
MTRPQRCDFSRKHLGSFRRQQRTTNAALPEAKVPRCPNFRSSPCPPVQRCHRCRVAPPSAARSDVHVIHAVYALRAKPGDCE